MEKQSGYAVSLVEFSDIKYFCNFSTNPPQTELLVCVQRTPTVLTSDYNSYLWEIKILFLDTTDTTEH